MLRNISKVVGDTIRAMSVTSALWDVTNYHTSRHLPMLQLFWGGRLQKAMKTGRANMSYSPRDRAFLLVP